MILITGANGFLGYRLAAHLHSNHELLCPSHSEMDFTNEEQVLCLFEKKKPTVVIHCGAVSDTGICQKNPELSYQVNVAGSIAIAKACQKYFAKLIFCSSDQIYNGDNNAMRPHLEEEMVSPQNVYGKHKLEAEKRILDYCQTAVCLRLSWMYDSAPKKELEHGNIFKIIQTAIEKKQPLSFPIHDIRGITHVKNVVENIEKTFTLPGGIYNFGSENELSTYQTVATVFHLKNIPIQLNKNEEAFAANPRNLSMNIDKIKKQGIDFPTTLSELQKCDFSHSNESY